MIEYTYHFKERRDFLTRHLRQFSNTQVYHIIIKGIDGQDIFYEDSDRKIFLNHLQETKAKYFYKIFAYCLMSNHVHLVLSVEDDLLSKSVQSLTLKYVHYFNKKYKRTGPFVQNRFNSKVVENQRYFLEVCRYVHRNPENAGFAQTQNYEWSSYKEYINKSESKLINKETLLYFLDNNIDNFIAYTTQQNIIDASIDDPYYELNNYSDLELINKLSDNDVINIIMKRFDISEPSNIPFYFKSKSKDFLKPIIQNLKQIKGVSKAQIARITRISLRQIDKF